MIDLEKALIYIEKYMKNMAHQLCRFHPQPLFNLLHPALHWEMDNSLAFVWSQPLELTSWRERHVRSFPLFQSSWEKDNSCQAMFSWLDLLSSPVFGNHKCILPLQAEWWLLFSLLIHQGASLFSVEFYQSCLHKFCKCSP